MLGIEASAVAAAQKNGTLPQCDDGCIDEGELQALIAYREASQLDTRAALHQWRELRVGGGLNDLFEDLRTSPVPSLSPAAMVTLAMHTVIAHHLNDELIEQAEAKLAFWAGGGHISKPLHEEWDALLRGSREELRRTLCGRDHHAIELRRQSPFRYLLDPPRREAIRALAALS